MTARADNAAEAARIESSGASIALWFGLLGGPAAGFANVLVNYSAVSRACAEHNSLRLHVSAIVFLLIAVAAGVTSLSLRRGWEAPRSTRLQERRRFMATVGILTALVSVFAIILQWIPIFVLGACYSS
jgi:hypothetical protein